MSSTSFFIHPRAERNLSFLKVHFLPMCRLYSRIPMGHHYVGESPQTNPMPIHLRFGLDFLLLQFQIIPRPLPRDGFVPSRLGTCIQLINKSVYPSTRSSLYTCGGAINDKMRLVRTCLY